MNYNELYGDDYEERRKKVRVELETMYGVQQPKPKPKSQMPSTDTAVQKAIQAVANYNSINAPNAAALKNQPASGTIQIEAETFDQQPKPVEWQTRPYMNAVEEADYNGLTAAQIRLDQLRNTFNEDVDDSQNPVTQRDDAWKKHQELEKEAEQVQQQIDDLMQAKKKAERQDKIDQMEAVKVNHDFSQVAQQGAQGVPTYEQLQQQYSSGYEAGRAGAVDNTVYFDWLNRESHPNTAKFASQLSKDQMDIYNYYYAHYGKQKADEYLELLQPELSEKSFEESVRTINEDMPDWYRTILPVITDMFAPLTWAENTINAARGADTDINQGATALTRLGNYAQEQTLNKVENPLLRELAGLGYSGANMLTKLPFGPAALPYMAASAAGNKTASVLEEDGDEQTAFFLGTLSGITEYLTEKLPLDNLFKMAKQGGKQSIKQAVKDVLKQAGMEGTEEIASEYANNVYDIAIRGDNSEYAQYKNDLISQGVSEEEATRQANYKFFVENPVRSALGGALLGGTFGTGAAAINASNNGMTLRDSRTVTLPDGRKVGIDQNGNPVLPPSDTQQTITLENDVTSPANTENAPVNGTEAGRTVVAPVKVGQNTVIQSPYNGKTPVYAKPKSNTVPVVQADSLATASQQIATAKNQQSQSGKSFRNYLKSFYNNVFEKAGGVREVTVNGLDFDGQPYIVTVNKNTVGKVISDPNLSAEKLALFDILNDVIQNGEYVGSGSYIPHGSRTKNVTRYDYFETPIQIGGKDYLASFDVEVIPGHNNYRTHKVINEIDLTSTADGEAGPVPAASALRSGLSTPIIPTSSQNSNRVFAPGITSTRENGKTISWSETQKDSVTNPAKAFEEKWGIKTKVVKPDSDTDAAAFIKDGTVYLNADQIDTFEGAVGKIAHEAAHAIENTPYWNEIKKAAAAYYRAVDPTLKMNDLREAVRERYKGVAELDNNQAAAEVVAGFMEDICSQNNAVGERAAKVLIETSPNGFKRVVRFLKDKVKSLQAYMPVGTGLSRQQRHELQAAQKGLRNLEKGLKAYRKGKVEAVQSGVQYSVDKPFSQSVDEIAERKQGKAYETSHVYMGKTPKVLTDLGLDQLPMLITSKHIDTIMNASGPDPRANYHGLGKELVKQIPKALENPVMVMMSNTKPDQSIVVLTTLKDSSGNPVISAIQFNGKGLYNQARVQANVVTSTYGKKFINNFIQKAVNENRVLYFDKQKSQQLNQDPGVQFPDVLSTTDFSSNIARLKEFVNRARTNNSISKTSKNDTAYSYGKGSFTDYYLEYVNRKYGTIPKGEKAYRDIDVPLRTSDRTKTRRGVRTILEAKSTPDSAVEALKKDIAKEAYVYKPEGDKAAISKAQNTIQTRGWNGALNRWENALNGAEPVTKEIMALGETLMAEAGKSGNVELFQKLAAEISAEATRSGQAVQAMRLIKKFTPEGQLYYVQKTVDNLQKKLDRRMKSKAPELELDPELAKKLLEANTTEEIEAASMEIMKSVAEQMPSTWQDKWDAWRYLAMLANPRTHIRNVLGNTVFVPARMIKNGAVMLVERAEVGNHRLVKPENRTQAVLTRADRPLREFAERNFETVKDSLVSTGKLNPSNLINEMRPVYTSKTFAWLEKLRKLNNRALEAEDLFFLKHAYVSSMAKAIKARKLDVDFLQSGTREATAQLRDLERAAVREAMEATYRDASSTASALNRFKETNTITNIFGNALFPFTKTPINVLKRGVEYSPIGLVKGILDMTYGIKSGKKTAAEAVGSLCKGLSGMGITVLGYWLSSIGLLVAGGPEDEKEQSFEVLQGAKTYALKIGDTYYTIDWMAPVALPLFVGAEAQKMAEGEGFDAANIIDSMTRISEPMFNLSMLDGINSAFKSIQYSSGAPLTDFAVEAALDYITQALPTLGGQIARTVDPTARNSYYIDTKSSIPVPAQSFLNAAQAKIPFLSYMLSPKVDQWGRVTGKKDVLVRAFENFLSPGYISTRNETPVDREIAKIYKGTGNSSILPRTAENNFKVDGETYKLSTKEYTEYAKERGERSYQYINELLSMPEYKALDPDEKAEVIIQMYEAANAESKQEVNSDYDLPKTVIKAYEANKQAGVLYGEYYLWKMSMDKNPTQREVIEALNRSGLTKAQKRYLFHQRFPQSKRKPFG